MKTRIIAINKIENVIHNKTPIIRNRKINYLNLIRVLNLKLIQTTMKAKTNFIVLGVIVGLSILFLVSFHYFRDAAVDNLLSFGLIGVFSLTFVMDFIIHHATN